MVTHLERCRVLISDISANVNQWHSSPRHAILACIAAPQSLRPNAAMTRPSTQGLKDNTPDEPTPIATEHSWMNHIWVPLACIGNDYILSLIDHAKSHITTEWACNTRAIPFNMIQKGSVSSRPVRSWRRHLPRWWHRHDPKWPQLSSMLSGLH